MTEQSTQREVARGQTGIVFYNYTTHKVASMPASFQQKLTRFTEPSAEQTLMAQA
jgi:acyl-CoA thioesterase FadM